MPGPQSTLTLSAFQLLLFVPCFQHAEGRGAVWVKSAHKLVQTERKLDGAAQQLAAGARPPAAPSSAHHAFQALNLGQRNPGQVGGRPGRHGQDRHVCARTCVCPMKSSPPKALGLLLIQDPLSLTIFLNLVNNILEKPCH